MEQIIYKGGTYNSTSELPVFYIASTEFQYDFNFKYISTVIGKDIQFDKLEVDYNSLNAYGYTTLNDYTYNSDTGTITVDLTITLNRMTAGAMLGAVSVIGTVVVKCYLNDSTVKTLTSTINPTFKFFDKSKASVIKPASITIPDIVPGYNDYSVAQSITLTNILSDSLVYSLDWIGNVDNVSSNITDSTFNLKWTEYYFPIKYNNTLATKDITPELNCQFVLNVEGISSESGRRISVTSYIDKAYNTLLDNISVQTKQSIGWQEPKYNIVIDRINNYSATISTTQFIDSNEHTWFQDKQIVNTESTQYTVSIYSAETKITDSGYYRIYFSNGLKVDILLIKNGYPDAYTPTLKCNFTLPIPIEEECDYTVKRSTDIRKFNEEILSGVLYPFGGTSYLQLGDIFKYYSDNIDIVDTVQNITTDTKHNFSWASKLIYKNYIYNVTANGEDYYISPYVNYNSSDSNLTNSVNLVSFYKKIYKDIPFYISISCDYHTELNYNNCVLVILEWNSKTNKWDSLWTNNNYGVCNGIEHQWFKYNGESKKLKVQLTIGNSIQYTEFEVVDNNCLNDSYGYLYYTNSYGGIDLIGINATSQENRTITNSTIAIEEYSDYKTSTNTIQYNKEVQKNWSAKTDLVTDDESRIYADLFESNTLKLYLNDMWYDVNITDTKYTIKSLRNNSYKKFNLSFTLEETTKYNKVK